MPAMNSKDRRTGHSRRTFVKLSGAAILGSLTGCRDPAPVQVGNLEIELCDDMLGGHLLFEHSPAPSTVTQSREVLVVGGGVAGLSAAYRLRERDPLVCELGRTLGGSSAFGFHEGTSFARGAHYELEQPAYYGEEVLALLSELDILTFNPVRDTWEFVEKRFLIDPARENRCLVNGRVRDDVLPESLETEQFENLLAPFEGQFPQPTRLIRPELRYLDQVSFTQYLETAGLPMTPSFQRGLDYQMKDDYGDGAGGVSALAGIHYYRCRPYYTRHVAIFSPPQGNGYFIEKLSARLNPESLLTQHLVTGIREEKGGFRVDTLHTATLEPKSFRVKQVVFAGHKQGLRYIYPRDADFFARVVYAPWVVMNFVLEGRPVGRAWWQNEVLGSDSRFLGFVNSMAQTGPSGSKHEMLTAYYCLPQSQRESLLMVKTALRGWVATTMGCINEALGVDISSLTRKVYVTIHGHGMPIPRPGYLFRDGNRKRSHRNLVYAGVDNGRLPLVFEALDSGLLAADLLSSG